MHSCGMMHDTAIPTEALHSVFYCIPRGIMRCGNDHLSICLQEFGAAAQKCSVEAEIVAVIVYLAGRRPVEDCHSLVPIMWVAHGVSQSNAGTERDASRTDCAHV